MVLFAHAKGTVAASFIASLTMSSSHTYPHHTAIHPYVPPLLLLLAVLLAVSALTGVPTLPQYAHYHDFADQRDWLGIPHAGDVLSNLPFALGGVWGLWQLRRLRTAALRVRLPRPVVHASVLFFAGMVATALGSGYYHWQPNNAGLLLDRLGMVLPFAGLLGLWSYEHLGQVSADRSSHPTYATAAAVLLGGVLALWAWSARGNLFPWVVLQTGGMLVLLLGCMPAERDGDAIPAPAWTIQWQWVLIAYALAKLCEWGDHPLWHATQGWVSGHSLKHVLAAAAVWPVLQALHRYQHNAPHDKETLQ